MSKPETVPVKVEDLDVGGYTADNPVADEVEKLADALYEKWVDEPFRNIRESFREVARAAAAVGARTAVLESHEIMRHLVGLNNCRELLELAKAYATDEETTT